jgi:hypothetical protein
METAQLFFRTRDTKNAEEVLDKVQSYLAGLLHNGQIVGDRAPMAKSVAAHGFGTGSQVLDHNVLVPLPVGREDERAAVC